jgi:NAD(P)-dependent dehydrogenase (short-subunit alcohol dehydrogenase family)
MDAQNPVVVITGASAGVGRATAREFARRGARIALLARPSRRLKATRSEINESGSEALDIETDVADPEQVENAAATAEAELGPISVWVNNAMASVFSPVIEMTANEYRRVTDVTYLGVVYGTLAALKRMQQRDSGTILQVGSALAHRAIPLQSSYCAAKHAIEGFTESLRCELLHDGSNVEVTMVQLPALNTPQFEWVKSRLPKRAQPIPPIYQPELAARAIVWAADHPRREVWVGGSTVMTLLANKLAPGLLDRYLARTNFEAQQTDQPEDPERPNNLWLPVGSDEGARGRFDDRAKDSSLQFWTVAHRRPVTAAAAGALLLSRALLRRRSVRLAHRR